MTQLVFAVYQVGIPVAAVALAAVAAARFGRKAAIRYAASIIVVWMGGLAGLVALAAGNAPRGVLIVGGFCCLAAPGVAVAAVAARVRSVSDERDRR